MKTGTYISALKDWPRALMIGHPHPNGSVHGHLESLHNSRKAVPTKEWSALKPWPFSCTGTPVQFSGGQFDRLYIKNLSQGFPGGAVVEGLPANAGDAGSSPGLGRSHMPRSGWAREPQLLSLRVWSLCSAGREAAMVRDPRTAMRSGPRLPQLDRALAQ